MAKNLLIVPTYNEAENIRDVLTKVIEGAPNVDILVVDDTSPDRTSEKVREFAIKHPNVHLLLRANKEGLAKAYLAGFEWGLTHGYEQLIQMDADLSHNPKDIPRLLAALENSDVAVGSRYVKEGGITGWTLPRQLISRGGNLYAKLILSVACQDLTGGFNAWKRGTLEKINLNTIQSRGYAFQVEMKYRALQQGLKVIEVPIIFRNRILGYSKMTGHIVTEAAWRVIQIRQNNSKR